MKWYVNCIWGFYSSGQKKVSWSACKQNGFKNHTYTNSSQGNFSLGLLELRLTNQQTHILLMSEKDAGKICLF